MRLYLQYREEQHQSEQYDNEPEVLKCSGSITGSNCSPCHGVVPFEVAMQSKGVITQPIQGVPRPSTQGDEEAEEVPVPFMAPFLALHAAAATAYFWPDASC